MKKYSVQLGCGCCDAQLEFKDNESIERAFKEAGLGSGVTIKDECGNEVEGIDTFYGFREINEDGTITNEEGHLERLMNEVNKKL